jgi:nitrous oxidase accessory protein NosD
MALPDEPKITPTADAGTPVSQVDARVTVPADSGVSAQEDAAVYPDATTNPDASVAFTTIQAAINSAAPGAVIDVPNGTYTESLLIDKALTLRGQSAEQLIVVGQTGLPVLQISASGVFVEGMTLQGSGNEGVILLGSANLSWMIIQGTTGAGIRVRNTGSRLDTVNLTVSNVGCEGACAATNWGEGVVLESGTQGVLVNTNIEDTDFIGVLVSGGATLSMNNGWILRAGRTRCAQDIDACSPGIASYAGSTVTLENNTWIQQSGASGIHSYATVLTVRDSEITNNGGVAPSSLPAGYYVDGVRLESTNATMNNNIISNNLGFGLGCEASSQVMRCVENTYETNGQGRTNGACGGC